MLIDETLQKLNPKVVTQSAAADQDEVAERMVAKRKQKEGNIGRETADQEEKAPEEYFGWQVAHGGTQRVE